MPGPMDEAEHGSDEVDRHLQDMAAGVAGPARFTEPSAAERANRRVESTQRMGWRAARKAKRLRKPVHETRPSRPSRPRRAKPASWPDTPTTARPRRSRPALRAVFVSLVLVAALTGITYGVSTLLPHGLSAFPGDQTPVTNGPVPPTQPSTPSRPAPSLADPFAGSPAESFADGAAGITIPPAHPVGMWSTAQVAAAYHQTKRLLIAAHLNVPTLQGQAPEAFARLLIPLQRTYFNENLDKTGLNSSGEQNSTRGYVTSFAPGSTELVGHVVKVHGSMRATTGRNGQFNTLRIHADFLFVYPVERPGQPSTLMRIVVRDDVNVDFAAYTDPGGPLEPSWNIVGGGATGARCDVNDGFVHPQFSNGPPDRIHPHGLPIDPYDLTTPPGNHGCQAATRA